LIEQYRREKCDSCGYLNGLAEFILTPEQKHYGKYVCPNCGCYWKFAKKPDNDSSKYRRPQKHRDLVRRFGNGYCELCLTSEDNLPDNQTLEGHHVIPFKVEQVSERENVWIVCTRCHRQIELIRTYNDKKCVTTDGPIQARTERTQTA